MGLMAIVGHKPFGWTTGNRLARVRALVQTSTAFVTRRGREGGF
jgi:hypothetical protein